VLDDEMKGPQPRAASSDYHGRLMAYKDRSTVGAVGRLDAARNVWPTSYGELGHVASCSRDTHLVIRLCYGAGDHLISEEPY